VSGEKTARYTESKSMEIDLSNPEGRAAYNKFLMTGELPEPNAEKGIGADRYKTWDDLPSSNSDQIIRSIAESKDEADLNRPVTGQVQTKPTPRAQ
jgi:hypothetical protein